MENSALILIEVITAVDSIATPILLAVFSTIGWTIKRRVEISQWTGERAEELEEELHDDHLKDYNGVLESFVIISTKD